MAASAGVVMTVVTMAINTIMVKRAGEMTPRSRPMLRIMSSMRPRVFINTPRAAASRQPSPVVKAATVLPPNLPSVATPMISRQNSQRSALSRSPTWVRNPV
jgi:hypothetical protein